MSEPFYEAMLERIRCEREALITQRESMIAANQAAIFKGVECPYGEQHFAELHDGFCALAPDPHNFA